MVTTTTLFGYTVDVNNKVIGKYISLSAGLRLDIPPELTYKEVATQAELDNILVYQATQIPGSLFNSTIFVQQLMIAFSADANILPYYAVIKDLAIWGNFYGMNILVNGLLKANKITSDEVKILDTVLASQNIVLSTFTTPP